MDNFNVNIVTTGALMTMLLIAEKLKGYKRSINDYIMIAMMILLATCLTKIYADEIVSEPYIYITKTAYSDVFEEEFNDCLGVESFELDKECKWVPKGVPSRDVDENGMISETAKARLRTISFEQLVASRNLHQEKFFQHRDEIAYLCLNCTDFTCQDAAKALFFGLIAGWATPLSFNYWAAFIAAAGVYGIKLIDTYFEMEEHSKMMNWHGSITNACNEIIYNRK